MFDPWLALEGFKELFQDEFSRMKKKYNWKQFYMILVVSLITVVVTVVFS